MWYNKLVESTENMKLPLGSIKQKKRVNRLGIDTWLKKVLDDNKKDVKKLEKFAAQVNQYDKPYRELSDEELAHKTVEFKERLAKGETLNDIMAEAFAVVREASDRILGMRHFDVQIMGGHVLHEGRIAEMKTGEGKTLVATAPVYLNALEGKGVHVVTVNDYLANNCHRFIISWA